MERKTQQNGTEWKRKKQANRARKKSTNTNKGNKDKRKRTKTPPTNALIQHTRKKNRRKKDNKTYLKMVRRIDQKFAKIHSTICPRNQINSLETFLVVIFLNNSHNNNNEAV